MNLQDAQNCLRNLLNYLWNHPDRFASGDIDELIQALEEFAIPLIDERIKTEEIAERFADIGTAGEILTQKELEYVLGIRFIDCTELKGKEI